ncbi:hypothetical protein DFJ74DRAFT_605145 [Hyaloraphidium curvatum]|nr:hypothetical protein DFJ74DRAFT_605145 [Hyaloraphidium curvatum]
MQMHRIARHHELQTKALLQPLLPDLSVQLIGIIGTQSQTVKDVSERLLNLSIKDFLERTLRYTLPHLVLQRNSDALAQLASVLKTDGAMLCVEHAHHILAKLFMEDEFEGSIAYLLSLVSPDGAISRFNLVKACALDLIAALTFELGSGSAARQSTVTRALETVQRELNADRSIGISATGPASLAKFLGHHFLGILAYANAQVRNETVSVSSRTAVLRSLAVVIKLLGPGVTIFTSQLLAAFQASLAIPELRSACLDGWDALLHTLDAATLGPNLGHVILALTSQGNLDDAHRKRIVAILRRTLEGSSVSLGRVLPDMVVQPTDRAFREALKPWTTDVGQLALPDALRKLLTACGKESPLVVENAVLQLRDLMRASEAWLASTVLSDSPDPVVSDLVPTLFETCHRFREESEPIVRLCGDCIGIVGAIDPARLSSGGKDDFELVVESFGAHRDAVAFVCRMLERQLVPAFKSSQDPVYQDPVAYAIQELLSFCGFTKDTPTLNPAVDSLAKMWHDFSPGVAQAIRPLLDSRYSVAPYPKRPVTYPIFRSRTTHRDWTRTLALDLIPRVVGSNAQKIFSVCESVVRNDVFGFSSFLLPHMVLNIVLCGTAADKDQLAIEILALVEEAATTSDPDDNLQRMCQTTFSLLDHLNAWMRSKYAARSRLRPSRAGGAADPVGDQQLADAHDFLGRVPHNVLAHASLNCKSYSRALKHVELHIREEERKKSGDDRVLPWLGLQLRLLANLDDADSMEGVSEKVTMPAMDQEVLQHEAAGRWTAAQSCYEMLLQSDAGVLDHHLGLMKCQRQLGHFESLLAHVNGTLAEHPEWSRTLNAHRIEASWRLGSWDSLDRFLESDFEPRFEASVGGLLSAITKDDKAAFERQISALRAQLSGAFSSSISGTYAQSYDIALKLHMLEDVQSFYEGFGAEGGPPDRLQNLVKLFESRVDITVPSHRVQEPLLDLRRASTRMHAVNSTQHMAGVHLETGRLWLKSAKIARKAGYFQAAYSDILHAAKVDAPFLQVEKAKWMWSQGDKYRALTDLNRFVQSRAAGSDAAQGERSRQFCGGNAPTWVKGHLLLARWMEETSGGQTSAVIAQYEKTTREHAWEKVYFYLGRYYIKLLENERAKEAAASKSNPGQRSYAMTLQIVKMFSRALQHGTKYIYQTMPRMLTLYLDLGNIAGMTSYEANQPQQSKDQTFHAMNKHMRKVVGYLPAYQFLSAFPQILSQICHRNPLVFSVLETIMINVLTAYPQQGLWQLIPVSKSTFSARAKRGEQVLNKIKVQIFARSRSLQLLIPTSLEITDELLHLAQYKDVANPKATSFSISRDFKNLHKASHLSMIVPMQSLMSVNMPSDNQTVANHSPFGKDLVTIQRFMDEVEVMPSLVKPKKIAILGSDGKKYFFLCKPSDDLRKDARLMEFNTLVNRLLKKNPETRKRRLYIRTYFVTPLNEDSGMIEWVNNLVGFRNIIANHWSRRSLQVHAQEVKDAFERQVKAEKDNRPKDAVASFKALYPPVFHEWFLETFPEPNAWLAARTAYTRTCAAISMVGYVVGLGDRHGENILFDSTNGDTVHVDLNCLFEKGLTFERPERVPFRLTQNMVDGFGTTGVEGMFRKSCEETMRVLRTNKDSLMSVLETFTHDPLLEWKKAKMVQERDSLEVRNESAIRSLAAIKTKLDGIISSKSSSSAAGSGLPLSVEGQVRELISSATDLFNLSMMYVGWASHL